MNGLFKLFMDIFVLFEKISALESESSAWSLTLTLGFLQKVARLDATHTLIRGIGEGVLSQRISYENIGQLRKFLLERSLFDNKRFGNKLFQSDTILTSTSIQRRFQLAVKSRASKNPVVVNPKFWLLSKEETQSFIKMHPILNNSEKKPDYSQKNPEDSENNAIKKRKENVVVVVVKEREEILQCFV